MKVILNEDVDPDYNYEYNYEDDECDEWVIMRCDTGDTYDQNGRKIKWVAFGEPTSPRTFKWAPVKNDFEQEWITLDDLNSIPNSDVIDSLTNKEKDDEFTE